MNTAQAEKPSSKNGDDFVAQPMRVLCRAVFLPAAAFRREETRKIPRLLLISIPLILTVGSLVMNVSYHLNPLFFTIFVEENSVRIERQLSAGGGDINLEAWPAAISALGRHRSAAVITGQAARLLCRIGLFFAIWLTLIVLPPFWGGEEAPLAGRKHRGSQVLALYALLPLSIRDLLAALVLATKDYSTLRNVVSIDEYWQATRISFSFFPLLGLGVSPGFWWNICCCATDPFCLWSLFILVAGGSELLEMSHLKMTGIGGFILCLLALQRVLIHCY